MCFVDAGVVHSDIIITTRLVTTELLSHLGEEGSESLTSGVGGVENCIQVSAWRPTKAEAVSFC